MKEYEDWTIQDFMNQHKKVWNWIAQQTLKHKRKVSKHDYFERKNIKTIYTPENYCYACEVAAMEAIKRQTSHLKMCMFCPINWDTKKAKTSSDRKCMQSVYGKWVNETDYKKCAELARKIANMPLIR